jgi:PQQ-dependent dehydrogenase (methanol/ethanol family)
VVVDGVIYVTTAWSKVYAVNAKTGAKLWSFDPKVPGPSAAKNCCDVVSRGAAVYHGKVYVGTYDGRLIALDAATGAAVWTAVTADPGEMYTISGAPRVGAGLVFIGNGGGEFGGRGCVSAYDADSGQLLSASFMDYALPHADMFRAFKTVFDQSVPCLTNGLGSKGVGELGTIGATPAVVNAVVDALYLATGTAFPGCAASGPKARQPVHLLGSRAGRETGHYKWHYQETPGDSWDYDSIADMILVDLNIGGTQRKVLMHTPKNGFNIDRRDGKPISAEPYVPGVTWASHVDLATGRPDVLPAAYYTNKPVRLARVKAAVTPGSPRPSVRSPDSCICRPMPTPVLATSPKTVTNS